MGTREQDRQRELEKYVQKRLGQYRRVLEAFTGLDNARSADAEDVLQILDNPHSVLGSSCLSTPTSTTSKESEETEEVTTDSQSADWVVYEGL